MISRRLLLLLAAAIAAGSPAIPSAQSADELALPVWRAQVRIAIADVSQSGTDDSVNVQLSENNVTWLDSGDDDFERRSSQSYNLRLDTVSTLADIAFLRLSKEGEDGICVNALELLINGVPVASRVFGNTADTCLAIDVESGLANTTQISFAELRSDQAWVRYLERPAVAPFVVARQEMESRIEGIVGDFNIGRDLGWGVIHEGRAVEVTRSEDQGIHVDLDLALFGIEVDVDFDLRTACIVLVQEGETRGVTVTFETSDPRVAMGSAVPPGELQRLGRFLGPNGPDTLARALDAAFRTYFRVIAAGDLTCPPIAVSPDGALSFATSSIGKPRPVIVVPGTGASILVEPGSIFAVLPHGWPTDTLVTLPIASSLFQPHAENLEFTEAGQPRDDTLSSRLRPGCCLPAIPLPPGLLCEGLTGGGLFTGCSIELGGAKEPLGQLIGGVSDLVLSLQDARHYDSRNFAGEGQYVSAFAHDFRLPVRTNAEQLDLWVEHVLGKTGSAQVDLVGHSRGNLVIKDYLTLHPEKVGTAVLIAPPNLGAPKALKALRYGDDLDQPVIDGCKVKRAAHNMPGLLNQLPGRKYLEVAGAYIEDRLFLGGMGLVSDFDELLRFLKFREEFSCLLQGSDAEPLRTLSPSLLESEFVAIQDARDNWRRPDSVNVFTIAGYNNFTLHRIVEYLDDNTIHSWPWMTRAGDGTVPLESAEQVSATDIYYMDVGTAGVSHDSILGTQQVLDQVFNLLQHPEIRMSYGPQIRLGRPPELGSSGITFATFSPVRLQVFNPQGLHTGLGFEGVVDRQIPGSAFEQFGDQQFVTVPEGQEYRVRIEGTGPGVLKVWQTDIDRTGLPLRTLEWDAVQVRAGSVHTFQTQFALQNPVMIVDADGNGQPEGAIAPSNRFAGGAGPMLLADLNNDGRVDGADLTVVRVSLGTRRDQPAVRPFNPVADVNQDGVVDIRDYAWVSRAISAP